MTPIRVRAAQLIYTNVEKGPYEVDFGGEQVLFATGEAEPDHALSPAEWGKVVELIQYGQEDSTEVKQVFFPLTDTGPYLVAQVTPFEARDQANRRGHFLAHALVLKEQDFAACAYNPFLILDQFS